MMFEPSELRHRRSQRRIAGSLCLITACLFLPAIAEASGDDAGQPPIGVTTTTPRSGKRSQPLRIPGTMLPGESAELFAKTSGYVSEVNVDIGDRVRAGDALLIIDVPEMVNEMAYASAVLESKRAAVLRAQANASAAAAEVERHRAVLKLEQVTFHRMETLRAGNAIPEQELDESRLKLDIASANLRIAETHVAAKEADVVVAQAQIAIADATAAKLKTLMSFATVRAPFDGIITMRMADPGTFVRSAVDGATKPSLTIVRDETLRLAIDVAEADLQFVSTQTKATIQPAANADITLNATITRMAGALNPATRTMRCEIEVRNSDGALAPGMFARVTLALESDGTALYVPSRAVRAAGSMKSVVVVQDGRAQLRNVQIGYDDGITAQVIDGELLADDEIIVSAARRVEPGERVFKAAAAPTEGKQ